MLRQSILIAVFCTLAISWPVAQSRPELIGAAKEITARDQVEEWLTYYYQHPRPDLLVSALRFMSKDGWLQKSDAQAPLVAFLSRVFIANPDRLKGWAADVANDSEDEKVTVATALWMVDGDKSQEVLGAITRDGPATFQVKVKSLQANRPPDLLKDEINSPQFLDALWGAFFATGNERYVQRLISALPMLDAEGDVMKMLIGGAAQWSLTSNAVQHPKVMEICEAELRILPEDQKPELTKIIKSAREKSAHEERK